MYVNSKNFFLLSQIFLYLKFTDHLENVYVYRSFLAPKMYPQCTVCLQTESCIDGENPYDIL